MIINHDRRFIFFHVPKTAGWSVRSALAKIPGSIDIGKPTKHLTPPEIGTVADSAQVRGYFTFCFVRDPWERFGSLHRFQRNRHPERVPEDVNDYAQALADLRGKMQPFRATRPQIDFATGLSFVARFERLKEDMGYIARIIGAKKLRLKHKNASGEATCYRDKMTTQTQAIIAELYREDIERFGYH